MNTGKRELLIGIGVAVLATIIWSGNFVVARGVIHQIPPISLAFYRWATASLLLLPFAWKRFGEERPVLLQHKSYLFWTALSGVTIFNTLVYIAGHYSPAINLALIGTTTSPIFSIILAAIFLKEKIRPLRIAGVLICVAGILFLLSQGSWDRLRSFHFSVGDGWILLAALSFAIYNIFVKRKPAGIHPINFLFSVFALGTLLLLPAYLIELVHTPPVQWTFNLAGIILYLGAGASIVSFLCWNMAIARLGAARTALFGNLIPIFSILEAVWFLDEQFTLVHAFSGLLVIAGVFIANLKK